MGVTRSAGRDVPRGVLRGPIPPAAETRSSEHEPVDHLRVVEGEIDRDAAPERQTDQRHPGDGEVLEQRVEIVAGFGGGGGRGRTPQPASKIGRAHVLTPVTVKSRMPSSAWKKKKLNSSHGDISYAVFCLENTSRS